nr:ATP synthase F0 subunit 6 [Hydroides norvegica]
MFLKVLDFAYGRGNLPFGGFKKLWELWAMVFFSLVFSEVLPFSTQLTFLGYPLAVLVISGILSLWLSSFLHSPFGFLKGVVPSGVPALGVPFISVLMLISSWMRPLVLTMRLTMAAVLMVTLEGIFHYFCVETSDLSLASSYSEVASLSSDSAWVASNILLCWRENVGLFSMGFLGFSGVLGLEKLFYMSFQVTLLASLMMIYQLEHVGSFKVSKVA